MANQLSRWTCYGILVGLSVGCSTDELGRTMGSWQGSRVDEVVLAWGQPTVCEEAGGRRICSWHDLVSGASLSTAGTCVRSLAIDADGVVTGWRWRGDYCQETADRVTPRAQFERPDVLAAESLDADDVEVAATEPAEQPVRDRNR